MWLIQDTKDGLCQDEEIVGSGGACGADGKRELSSQGPSWKKGENVEENLISDIKEGLVSRWIRVGLYAVTEPAQVRQAK